MAFWKQWYVNEKWDRKGRCAASDEKAMERRMLEVSLRDLIWQYNSSSKGHARQCVGHCRDLRLSYNQWTLCTTERYLWEEPFGWLREGQSAWWRWLVAVGTRCLWTGFELDVRAGVYILSIKSLTLKLEWSWWPWWNKKFRMAMRRTTVEGSEECATKWASSWTSKVPKKSSRFFFSRVRIV